MIEILCRSKGRKRRRALIITYTRQALHLVSGSALQYFQIHICVVEIWRRGADVLT